MGITFNSTSGAINSGTNISPALPYNPAGTLMLAVGNVYAIDGVTKPVVTPPAGWTVVQDSGSFGFVYRFSFIYKKLGDGSSGTVVFTFNTSIKGNIDIVSYNEVNTTTPIKASSFKNNTTTTTPITTAIDTTGTANCMILAAWTETGDNYGFSTTDFSDIRVSRISGFSQSTEQAILIADGIQAAAGTTGIKTATSEGFLGPKIGAAFAFMVAIAPAPNPSVPTLTYPNGGESLTTGATTSVTWNPSTSPTAAQSTLKYNLDYSSNNGGAWTSIVSLTSAGVTSYGWTVPSTTGSNYLVRIRGYDPAITTYSLGYDQSNAAFSVVAETAPGQPVINSPVTGSVQNKAANVTVAWTHQGGAGNPQTEFTLQWANNSGFSGATTIGPTATSTQSTSIDFSAQANGATIYVKVKTKGLSLYSAYSNVTSFIVAVAPAAPNITAPVAASPPTTPLPTITFTEADPFVSRKMRVVAGSVETYNSGEVSSTATSFTSGYTFANNATVTFYISVKNTYGLWSAEDSETVTAAYTGPATPTLTIQAIDNGGYIFAQITNSDSPSYNELWRYEYAAGRATAIRVGSNLPADASFTDHNAASGVVYQYFARAYNSTGLFSDSTDSAVIYLTLDDSFLHIVNRASGSGNSITSTSFLMLEGSEFGIEEVAASHKLIGRAKPVGVVGQAVWQIARIIGVSTSTLTLAALMTIWRAGAVVCLRSTAGHRIFGRMTEPQSSITADNINIETFSFTIIEEDYTEAL